VSASRLKIPDGLRAMADLARRLEWTITRCGSGHLAWRSPDGTVVFTASTPSDLRGVRNARAKLRRAGLRLEAPWTST
jgi:hypothetical protein